ncbi:MAG: NTP transferase domain-containing protein [Planctomycetes bacterium]|nr:NTP transferase domain-containing protein [Planctomycetota bacterium]
MSDTTNPQPSRPLGAIILAAGKGTRMGSDLPKVMHEIGGEPMVRHVVGACIDAGCDRVVIVVGGGDTLVRGALADFAPAVEFAVQDEQLGTGHAVMCAREHFQASGRVDEADVFVLCGDGPLIRPATLETLLDRHRSTGAAATLATSVIEDPTGYGRVIRDDAGRFVEIVEHALCTPAQAAIREVNPSYYCFDAPALFHTLDRLERNEVSGELYVTDVPRILVEDGRAVEIVEAVPPEDVLSINTVGELAAVDEVFRRRRAAGAPTEVRRIGGGDR